MSLVPIIYTSLLIFSAVSLFVIVISYISFKTKTRHDLPPYLKNSDPRGAGIAVPSVLNRNSSFAGPVPIPAVKTIKAGRPSQKAIELERTGQNYNKTVQSMRRRSGESKIRKENSTAGGYRQNSRQEKITKLQSGTVSDRLLIVNNTERFSTKLNNEIQSKNSLTKRYTDHSDINVFNFYSDAPEMNLVALLTPQVKNAI